MKLKASILVAIVPVALLMVFSVGSRAQAVGPTIRFGILPVLQALPLFVAKDVKLFDKEGISVELILFNTAAEKGIALKSGSIDGYFGDLFTPIVLEGNNVDVSVVATNYESTKDRRMFAVLVKPGSKISSVKEMADVPVAVSSNSVIDFVTERLLINGGVPKNSIKRLESKNIGLRMQMLLSGQVEAATLPEPLVTAAEAKGARVIADDSGLPESQTILMFSSDFARKHPSAVKAFLEAVSKANRLIESEPAGAREVMTAKVRLPEELKDTYPVPKFPELHVPSEKTLSTAAEWLAERGVTDSVIPVEDIVDGSFLK